MIVSFGWTTPALLAGAKTVTRRDWKPQHAARFKPGMLVDAWNTSPRNVRGNPRKVATIRIVGTPYIENTAEILQTDYEAEGFEYLTQRGLLIDGLTPDTLWELWHLPAAAHDLYVVRFELVTTPGALPPRSLCECGCIGGLHEIVWEGETFKGTRCLAHGGHKFKMAVPA